MESRRPKILFLGEPGRLAPLATVFKNTDADVLPVAAAEALPDEAALAGFALAVLDWAWRADEPVALQALIHRLDRAHVPLIALSDQPGTTREHGGVETIPFDPQLLRLRANAYLEMHRLRRQLHNQEGQISGYREEVLALRETCDTLQRDSLTDGVTELLNRAGIEGYLRMQWRSCKRLSRLLSVALAEVDNLHGYEAIYGTATADQALLAVARTMQGCLGRAEDLMGRWERDRFLAVLPDATVEGAAIVGERIRTAVSALALEHVDAPAGIVTVTLGVCCAFPSNGGLLRNLSEGADTALRAAVSDGRNTVMMYNRLV
jgi:diguanylate cyclase (GGDEF)-like protein